MLKLAGVPRLLSVEPVVPSPANSDSCWVDRKYCRILLFEKGSAMKRLSEPFSASPAGVASMLLVPAPLLNPGTPVPTTRAVTTPVEAVYKDTVLLDRL